MPVSSAVLRSFGKCGPPKAAYHFIAEGNFVAFFKPGTVALYSPTTSALVAIAIQRNVTSSRIRAIHRKP